MLGWAVGVDMSVGLLVAVELVPFMFPSVGLLVAVDRLPLMLLSVILLVAAERLPVWLPVHVISGRGALHPHQTGRRDLAQR